MVFQFLKKSTEDYCLASFVGLDPDDQITELYSLPPDEIEIDPDVEVYIGLEGTSTGAVIRQSTEEEINLLKKLLNRLG